MPPGVNDNVKAPPSTKSDKYGTIVGSPNTHETESNIPTKSRTNDKR